MFISDDIKKLCEVIDKNARKIRFKAYTAELSGHFCFWTSGRMLFNPFLGVYTPGATQRQLVGNVFERRVIRKHLDAAHRKQWIYGELSDV